MIIQFSFEINSYIKHNKNNTAVGG